MAVRRSAGDALNDLGDPAALPPWRPPWRIPTSWSAGARRGSCSNWAAENLPALARAQDDPEFEVRMQVRQAMERIEGGQAAQGPVWMRMTQKRQG